MILLDILRAATNSNKLIEERDQAVLDYAEAQCQFIRANEHKRKLHAELSVKQQLLDAAAAANLHLEAKLAALDPSADDLRRTAWMDWSERLCDAANEQADIAGRRVLALEAWVAEHGGERDVIYAAAGLATIAEVRPSEQEDVA